MKNILVTGGAGFIGAHFILHTLKENNQVSIVNLDAITYAADLSNLKIVEKDERYTFIKGTICDYNKIFKIIEKYHIDTIVNFAAESHVDRSIESAKIFTETNIIGVLTLLQAAKSTWEDDFFGKMIVQISTDEVYGSAGLTNTFDENARLAPGNPYAASKASADLMCLAWNNTYGFPVVITRSSNNFGPFQHREKFIPQVIFNALRNEAIPIYGDGQNVRDWISVTDNVFAIGDVALNGKSGEIYNISAHKEIKNIILAQKVIDTLNLELKRDISYDMLTLVEDRRGHDFRYAMETNKIEEELGWRSKKDFVMSLYETILWYIEKFDLIWFPSQRGGSG